MRREKILLVILLFVYGGAFIQPASAKSAARLVTYRPTPKKPAPAPARWRGLIGEYGPDSDPLIILEKNGKLFALFKRTDYEPLDEVSIRIFKFSMMGVHAGKLLLFTREANGRAKQLQIDQQV